MREQWRAGPPWVTLSLMIVLAFAGLAGAAVEPQLLLVGRWHGDEAGVDGGEQAVGLFVGADGRARLDPTTIEVERVYDAVVDDEGETTGKLLRADGPGEPRFLLRGVELAIGEVTEVWSGWRGFSVERPLELRLGDKAWMLDLGCRRRVGDLLEDCGLTLVAPSGLAQTLVRYEAGLATGEDFGGEFRSSADGYPALGWAGDLDGDGRLDLLLDLTDHYNVSEPTLFLSSWATRGTLVGRVASFLNTGC